MLYCSMISRTMFMFKILGNDHIDGICLLRHMLCKLVESSTAGLKNYVVLKSFGAPNLTFSLIPEKEYINKKN
ncbi:hypothetical protein V1477_004556 [Vespula maculifrons]|uniref:Uncharacterized protein n=1 Tax=Vespula maculifrons TaxID=7453 RepID=A0ABD2CM57_VESMC